MDQPLYDIYFTGQLVDGIEISAGKSNLATLFKLSTDQADKYFNGKAHLLKRGIDKAGALKYKTALHKAGLLVAVKAHRASTDAQSTAAQLKQQPADKALPSQPEEDWSLAPAGSDVLKPNERKPVEKRDIDTSEIKMVSAFMTIEPEPQAAIASPDTRHISLAPTGEDLLEKTSNPEPAAVIDTDGISLAPTGTPLDELHPDTTPLNPDTSSMSIAEPGADLLEGQTKPSPPPAPNTDHIVIKPD